MSDLIPDASRREEVLSRLYKGDSLMGEGGIFTDMLQALVNAALEGEMVGHLAEGKSQGETNRRNGHTQKRVRSTIGEIEVSTPRDRSGTHNPKLIGKWDRELGTGLDKVILSLYARGQSVEDVRHQLQELYGLEISAATISAVTDKVWEEILSWQQRPLSSCYPIVYLDGIMYKVKENGVFSLKTVYTVYGIDSEGNRDILGLYLGEKEGARQWGLILEDLKKRGIEEVFFFCVDGLAGFKESIYKVFPQSMVQRCIVHLIRSSTRFVSDKDRRGLCADLRKIYTSANREQAWDALELFRSKWDKKYKEVGENWAENWEEAMAFMDYGPDIRRMIYTTNPVEVVHRMMRKVTKSKGAWNGEKALLKQLYLTLHSSEKSWKRHAHNWKSIQQDLKETFGERYTRWLEK